jgi:hypothetical protein
MVGMAAHTSVVEIPPSHLSYEERQARYLALGEKCRAKAIKAIDGDLAESYAALADKYDELARAFGQLI